GGIYQRHISRDATLHLGYVYQEGQFGVQAQARPAAVHNIDAGLDYHRALSFSRRTKIDFATGSTIVNLPAAEGLTSSQLQYRVTGTAGLTRDMGRTWRARLGYNRGVGFWEAFRE